MSTIASRNKPVVERELDGFDIRQWMPQRNPVLLVDQAKLYSDHRKLEAIKAVPQNEPFLDGHFPEYPIYPGIWILEALAGRPIQRIGLSATQRPLEEVARFLAGAEGAGAEPIRKGISIESEISVDGVLKDAETDDVVTAKDEARGPRYRPVTIVNAGARKTLELTVEVPVEDMARLGEIEELPSGPASQGPKRTSIWQSIHPRLLEIVRGRTSTLIFVNARRVAERLAGALNELAGEPIARAHHGSLAAARSAAKSKSC